MKKIAILTCTTGLNMGNDFINQGLIYVVKRFFPNDEIKLFESLETVNDNYKSYLLPYKKELNSCDIIFISCGSLISKVGIVAIKNILKLKPIKIFMGLGMFKYNDEEKEYCKLIEKYNKSYFFVRDNDTYRSFLNKRKNIFRGIDLAFFVNEVKKKIKSNKYAVINLDSIQDNLEKIKEIKENLKKHYKNIYIVENTTHKYKIEEFKDNYVFLSHWYSLYQLYQNASYVITNRIHTTVSCLTNFVPVSFIWTYKEKTKRLDLFKRVGIIVKEENTILTDYRQQIEEYKNKFLELFEEKIKGIIHD